MPPDDLPPPPGSDLPEFLPAEDPFGRTASLLHAAQFPVLGVPLRVRSNARETIRLAATSFGAWLNLAPDLVDDRFPAALDIVIQRGDTRRGLPERLEYRRHGDLFLAAGGEFLGAVRLDTQHAVAFAPAAALSQGEWFAAHVLGLGLLAASQHDRVPIHASAVVHRGTAALLVGASGSGKSTLAYACARAGLAVLAEDAVFVSLGRGIPRLWGYAARAWLGPGSAAFFPELLGHSPVTRANGKTRLDVPIESSAAALCHEGRVVVVALRRGGAQPSLAPLAPEGLAALLDGEVDEGFDQYLESRPAVVTWLARCDAFELECGTDPSAAAAMLRAALDDRASG